MKPTILLLESKFAVRADVCEWLDKKGFNVWQTENVYALIEDLSDFTGGAFPDVIVFKSAAPEGEVGSIQSALRMAGCDHELFVWNVPRSDSPGLADRPNLRTEFGAFMNHLSKGSATGKSASM